MDKPTTLQHNMKYQVVIQDYELSIDKTTRYHEHHMWNLRHMRHHNQCHLEHSQHYLPDLMQDLRNKPGSDLMKQSQTGPTRHSLHHLTDPRGALHNIPGSVLMKQSQVGLRLHV